MFGHPVTAHLDISRSIRAHSQNLSNLFSCVCSASSLLAIAAMSSAYVDDEIFILDVPKVYPLVPCCSHLRRGSKNMINRYGLSVYPCIVPRWMKIGKVFSEIFSSKYGRGL